MAIAATGLSACDSRRPQSLTIDNALTADEIATGILTPEVMWKMSRAGSSSLSPDGRTLLYAQTDYNMAENRGVTTIWVEDLATKAVTRLTDTASNNADPKWSADGEKIYFLSDRSGSMQVWEMTPAGGNARQLSAFDKDVEGFGISPRGDKAWYVQRVEVCDRKSSDVYKDMDKSKARIYDDLMARHWNYWDEGSYLHIFVGDFGAEGLKPGVDIIGKDAAWDAPLAPYFDMAEIAWNNAGTMLAYTCKPLTGTEYAVSTDSDIFVYVLENGVTQNICKPVNVNTGEPIADMATMAGYDKYPVWSPDDRQIAFLSQRRAGNESDKARLFLYDCQTAQMQDLTEDFDYNAMNVVWSGSDMLYFIAPIEATHQICRIAPCTNTSHSIGLAFTTASISARLSSRARMAREYPSFASILAPSAVWMLIWVEPCRRRPGAMLRTSCAVARSSTITASAPAAATARTASARPPSSAAETSVFRVTCTATPRA